MFHFQTIVLGYFPFRLHAYKGRDVTHLMDDPDRRRRRRPRRRRGQPGSRTSAAASSSTAAAATRSPRRSTPRPGAEHSARDGRRRTVATRWPRSRCRARTCRKPTNRVDLDPAVRDVWGLPAGRVTYSSHAHDVACAHHWAPRLEAVMRDAGATRTRRGSRRRESPGTHRAATSQPISPPLDGHRRGWATTRARRCAIPWQRLWDVDNVRRRRLVGVPDVVRLRPDAHARRPRDPRRPQSRDDAVVRRFRGSS